METFVSEIYAQFPHIHAKMHELWGTKAGREYLVSLLFIDRDHRNGFPFDVIKVIDWLIDEHDKAFPAFKPAASPWDVVITDIKIPDECLDDCIKSFTAWADEKFGKPNPSSTARIYPQHERFDSYFKCWVDAKSGHWG